MEKKEVLTPSKQPQEIIRPPDGGWGWMVVFGSFMCNVIVDGIIFSYGLFLPELAKDLNESKGKLAWAGSLLAGFYLMAGPVVSGLANTYGTRPVTIVGAVISAISLGVASLSSSLEYLCLTFGVFGGIGFGFIYLPAVVSVGFYFERRRALATGLAVCGSGVGTFVMAPLVQHLLSIFGWRGCMLVLSGIILNCAFFGALFRPLSASATKSDDQSTKKTLLGTKGLQETHKGRWDSVDNILGVAQSSVSLPEMASAGKKQESASPVSSENSSPPPSYMEVVGADEEESYSFLQPAQRDNCLQKPSPTPSMGFSPQRRYSKQATAGLDMERPFYRKDILYSASLLHLPDFKQSSNNLSVYAASIAEIPAESPPSCLSVAMRDTFRQLLDMSLVKSPTFLLFALGGFLTLAGFFVPFMFVVDRAILEGIDIDDATYLLPAIGLSNTVGRIFCGWISDSPSLNALTLNNAALVIGGLVTALSTCWNTFAFLLTFCIVFGFCVGCFVTLRSIVIVELLGLDKLTNAFGLLLLFQGIASIIGAPVAGMFYDATGSYDAPFYIAGTLICISGFLGIPLPYVSTWEKRKKLQIPTITVEAPEDGDAFANKGPLPLLRRFSYDVRLEQPWCPTHKTCVYKTRLVPKLQRPTLVCDFDPNL